MSEMKIHESASVEIWEKLDNFLNSISHLPLKVLAIDEDKHMLVVVWDNDE